MSDSSYLLLFIVAAMGTLLLRASFLTLFRTDQLPQIVQKGLKLLPAAVLAGLAIPALVPAPGAMANLEVWLRPVAALIAVIVALRWNNMFLTLGVGMAGLWLMRWLV